MYDNDFYNDQKDLKTYNGVTSITKNAFDSY